jgi:hypothetical protein
VVGRPGRPTLLEGRSPGDLSCLLLPRALQGNLVVVWARGVVPQAAQGAGAGPQGVDALGLRA